MQQRLLSVVLCILGSLAVVRAVPCAFSVPAAGSSQCYSYDLGALPAGPFTLHSAYPDTYFASAPCTALAAANVSHDCPNSTGALAASGTKMAQQRPAGACLSCAGGKAIARVAPLGGKPTWGVELTFGGGDGGRKTVFSMVCNASVAEPSAPEHLVSEQPGETYHISWSTSLACPTLVGCTRGPTPAPTPLPLPSAAQLEYHADEKGSILHFNMGTFQSCGIGIGDKPNGKPFVPPPSTFNPAAGKIDTDQWAMSLKAYGARRAVLVVSHGCGFSTFPARTQFPQSSDFPNGFSYNYSIAHSSYLGGRGDLARDFVASCKKYGIKPGFYYGAMNNAYLNVVSGTVQQGSACNFCPDISQRQYTEILLAQLRQLWTDYGSLAELWFDGGYPPNTKDLISALQQELQPSSVGFQGPSVNSVRWAGTESGHVAADMWMTAASSTTYSPNAGDPEASSWFPPEADTCFQEGCRGEASNGTAPYGGCWFYNDDLCAPPLSSLISKFHDTVGRSTLLLLDMAPSQNGSIRGDHAAMYSTFGNWIRACYGTPAPLSAPFHGTLGVISGAGVVVDRIVLAEDLSQGQRVRSFTVAIDGEQVFAAKSIGNKRIVTLAKNVTVETNITVHILEAVAPPVVRIFEARQCASTPPPAVSCNAVEGMVFMGPLVRKQPVASADACCGSCRAEPSCAVYNYHRSGSCELLAAQSGTTAEAGATSGTPSH